MDEKISYGVFWKSTDHPNEFTKFFSWFSMYEDAFKAYKMAQDNPACIAAKIVERCESYKVVATTEKEPHGKEIWKPCPPDMILKKLML